MLSPKIRVRNGTVSLVIQEWGSFNLNTVENVLRKTSLTKPSANAHFVHHKINKNRTNPNRNSDHVSSKKYSPWPKPTLAQSNPDQHGLTKPWYSNSIRIKYQFDFYEILGTEFYRTWKRTEWIWYSSCSTQFKFNYSNRNARNRPSPVTEKTSVNSATSPVQTISKLFWPDRFTRYRGVTYKTVRSSQFKSARHKSNATKCARTQYLSSSSPPPPPSPQSSADDDVIISDVTRWKTNR